MAFRELCSRDGSEVLGTPSQLPGARLTKLERGSSGADQGGDAGVQEDCLVDMGYE